MRAAGCRLGASTSAAPGLDIAGESAASQPHTCAFPLIQGCSCGALGASSRVVAVHAPDVILGHFPHLEPLIPRGHTCAAGAAGRGCGPLDRSAVSQHSVASMPAGPLQSGLRAGSCTAWPYLLCRPAPPLWRGCCCRCCTSTPRPAHKGGGVCGAWQGRVMPPGQGTAARRCCEEAGMHECLPAALVGCRLGHVQAMPKACSH